jgi:hypothetical protein
MPDPDRTEATPLDRAELLSLLERLGDPDDAAVLAAARELDGRLRATGTSWEELLGNPRLSGAEPADGGVIGSFSDDDLDEPAIRAAGGLGDDEALIARLLSEHDLSAQTREDLEDMRAAMSEGEFTERDSRYLRDLLARLTGRTPD